MGAVVGWLAVALLVGSGGLSACGKNAEVGPWCSVEPAPRPTLEDVVTYLADVKPLLGRKCTGCHRDGGAAPFALETFAEASARSPLIAWTARAKHMPPWLADACCATYRSDLSLSEREIATLEKWALLGAPEGTPVDPPTPEVTPIGGLSRIDVTLAMPAEYTPVPRHGGTDDMRCFLLDWPYEGEVFVTGLNPRPGNRNLVHHLVVGAIEGAAIEKYAARQGVDGQPGFDCAGGLDVREIEILGGGLLGGDFPEGVGKKVKAGSKILLNVHYSLAGAGPSPDRTTVELRVDGSAVEARTLPITNPAWAVGESMTIEAGDPDAMYSFYYAPVLLTGNETVYLRNVAAHMHRYGSRIAVRVLRKDGTRDCLLEIPRWEFGWEQTFWFDAPHPLEPGDQLYVECHFDNSAAHQPTGEAPRDIAWGESDQEMCAAFVAYTEAP